MNHFSATVGLPRRAEENAKSCHFLINMSVQKFPKIALEPPEHPKLGTTCNLRTFMSVF